jgi:hypothetical protein
LRTVIEAVFDRELPFVSFALIGTANEIDPCAADVTSPIEVLSSHVFVPARRLIALPNIFASATPEGSLIETVNLTDGVQGASNTFVGESDPMLGPLVSGGGGGAVVTTGGATVVTVVVRGTVVPAVVGGMVVDGGCEVAGTDVDVGSVYSGGTVRCVVVVSSGIRPAGSLGIVSTTLPSSLQLRTPYTPTANRMTTSAMKK